MDVDRLRTERASDRPDWEGHESDDRKGTSHQEGPQFSGSQTPHLTLTLLTGHKHSPPSVHAHQPRSQLYTFDRGSRPTIGTASIARLPGPERQWLQLRKRSGERAQLLPHPRFEVRPSP